ncbi:MAG: flippase [Dysgonomonas sp.]|uniref:flippase n=1 Tax=Dysgonomonas sp. TaxID=1891233 RepID=UPI003A8B13D3
MSVKKNFIYNSILTISNYIFPLIIFPYISRVLGVTNIGICNFIDSIINFYILFAMMGVSSLGIREIAKGQLYSDSSKRGSIFSSIFLLNACSTATILIIYLVSIYIIPELNQHKELMYIGGVKILFNLFLIEWFYKGIENFKYITIRSIIIKFLYVISIFLFVKGTSDYNIYYALSGSIIVVNAIVNWRYKSKFVRFSLKGLELKSFIKPFFSLGIYALLTSMYTTFNVIFLGFMSGNKEVGYYTTATKLFGTILALFTAFTTVMLPRMSSLFFQNELEQIKTLTIKSFDLLFMFCLPVIFISVILTPEIIEFIAGPGYEGAIIPMRIVMPLVLVIGIAQILIIQMLMPLRKDNAILINSIIGATVGMLLNILLVKKFNSTGSALVLLCAEISVLISASFFVKKYLNIMFPFYKLLKNIIVSSPYVLICILSLMISTSPIVIITCTMILSSIYFIISQVYILKNQWIILIIKSIIKKCKP